MAFPLFFSDRVETFSELSLQTCLHFIIYILNISIENLRCITVLTHRIHLMLERIFKIKLYLISFMAIEDCTGHHLLNLCSDPTPCCLTAAQLSIACSCREPIGIQQAGFLLLSGVVGMEYLLSCKLHLSRFLILNSSWKI